MAMRKRLFYCLMAGLLLALCLALYNRCSGRAEVVGADRDTVVVYDTIPHYYPVPKDSAVVRYITRVLPSVRDGIAQYSNGADTVYHVIEANNMDHYADTSKMMPVVIPITSKHYQAKEYDAWVSGYEANLDSIKVYQKTKYITERVTVSKRPNKWELDAVAGIDYRPRHDQYMPRAALELTYKPNRLQVGVRAGVIKSDNFEPFVGAVMKVRLF